MSIKKKLISTISSLTLGQSITSSMRSGYGLFSFQKYLKALSRYRNIKQAMRHDFEHFFSSQRFYLENFSPQSIPLVLMPLLNLSNRSLLLLFFDGHPQLNVSPIELKLNQTDIENWPDFKLDLTPDRWFDILYDPDLSSYISKGFSISPIAKKEYPFVFSPHLLEALFSNHLSFNKPSRKREILDTYFSAFFVAWLNNQNISFKKKSYHIISSSLPLTKRTTNEFFELYPDGRLILLLCDPTEWLQSKLTMIPDFPSVSHEKIANLMKGWDNYINNILDAKKEFHERVCIINHTDLTKNINNIMLYLSKFLHIDFNDLLLLKTYNRIQVSTDTVEVQNRREFDKEAYSMRGTLADSDLQAIDELTDKIYKNAIKYLDPY